MTAGRVDAVQRESFAIALARRSGGGTICESFTAARYPPRKIEYITASAQPTPKTKPRKQPIAADQRTVMWASLAANGAWGLKFAHHSRLSVPFSADQVFARASQRHTAMGDVRANVGRNEYGVSAEGEPGVSAPCGVRVEGAHREP